MLVTYLYSMRWYFIILIVLTIGCKKEDEIPPVISVVSPFSMTQFQIPFQVTVTGLVEDENTIEWVKIIVLDDDLRPSSEEVLIAVNSNSVEFSETIYLDDIHLSSGVYFIKVSANDGQNINSSYVEIYIQEYPLILKNIFVIGSDNSQTTLFKIDSNTLELVHQFSGQFQLANSVSKYQYLFIGTDQIGNAFDPGFNQNIWNWTFNTFQSNYFVDSHVTEPDNVLHVCCIDGVIRSFTENGILTNTVYSSNQDFFDEFLVIDNYLFVEEYSSSTVRYITVYFLESGVEMQRIPLSNDVVDILEYSSNQCLFLEQIFSDVKINMYDLNSNVSWEITTISNDSIYDAEYVLNKGLYFTSDSGLMLYDLITNSMTTLIPNSGFGKITFDKLNETIYLLANNEIWIYSVSTGQYQSIYTNYNLEELLLFYNK